MTTSVVSHRAGRPIAAALVLLATVVAPIAGPRPVTGAAVAPQAVAAAAPVSPANSCAPDWTRVGTSLVCERVITASTTGLDLPDGVTFDVVVVGGGGGGGGGGGWFMTGPRRNAFTAGGGGGGGQVTVCTGLTLPDPVDITVGAGGTAGANVAANAVGNSGGAGSASSIGTCTASGGGGGNGGWGKTFADWTATPNLGSYGQGGTSGAGRNGMTASPYNPPTASTGAYGVWGGGGGGANAAATTNGGGQGVTPRNGLFASNSVVYGTGGGGGYYSRSFPMGALAATGAEFSKAASAAPANLGAGGGGGLGAGQQTTVFVDNASSAGGTGVVVLRYSLTITITASNVSSTYGSPIAPVSYTVNGLGSTDWLRPGLTCNAYNASTIITAPYTPGSYSTKCTGATTTGLGVPITYVSGTYTLNKAPLTITAADRKAIYGDAITLSGANPSGDWSITAGTLMYSDAITSVTLTTSGTPAGTDSAADAADYTITPSAAVGSGLAVAGKVLSDLYTITYTAGSLSKSKAPLTITARSLQAREGDAEPAYPYDITGWVLGETESTPPAGWASPSCDSTYTSASLTVDSPLTIACSGATATNYDITYVDGSLVVTPAAVIVTPQDVTATYDGTPATAPTAPGVSEVPGGYTFDEGVVTCAIYAHPESTSDLTGTVLKPGTYYVVCDGPANAPSTGAGDPLEVIYEVGTYTVNKAKLSVAVNDQSKEYGDTTVDRTATAFTVTGLVGSDALDVVLAFEGGDLATADVGTYDITSTLAFAASGPAPTVEPRLVDDYYSVAVIDGVLTVTPAVLQVTPEDLAPIFGESVTDYPYDILQTWKNGEGLLNLPAGWTAPTCTSTYQTTLPIGSTIDITCSSGAATNYVFEYGTATLTVSDPEVVITNTSERTYTTADSAVTVTLSAGVDKFVPGCEIIWTVDPSEGTDSPYSMFLDDTTPSLDVSLPLGVYIVTVSVDGNCIEKEAIDNPAVIVVSPAHVGAGTYGEGWYRTSPGGPKIGFDHDIKARKLVNHKVNGQRKTVYFGESTWVVKGEWRLKAKIARTTEVYTTGSLVGVQPYSTFICPAVWPNNSAVSPRCGAFTGEATLQRWVSGPGDDHDDDHGDDHDDDNDDDHDDDGHWETVGLFGHRTTVYDGDRAEQCGVKKCKLVDVPDFYGLTLWALPAGPAVPEGVQTSIPQTITYGQIRVHK